ESPTEESHPVHGWEEVKKEDPYSGDPPYLFECTDCGERVEEESRPGTCPECGGHMRNMSKPSER
ncbi:MAG: rubrerythrin-like domain-containing protein, partial [Halobacteriaceae archaeon]